MRFWSRLAMNIATPGWRRRSAEDAAAESVPDWHCRLVDVLLGCLVGVPTGVCNEDEQERICLL